MQRPSENYDTLRLRMIRARLLKGHLCPTAPFERRKQLRDLRDAGAASQGVQVGLPDAFEGFEEDGGQDDGSDAGNGPQDFVGASAFHRAEPAMPTRPLPGMDATASSITASVMHAILRDAMTVPRFQPYFPKTRRRRHPQNTIWVFTDFVRSEAHSNASIASSTAKVWVISGLVSIRPSRIICTACPNSS